MVTAGLGAGLAGWLQVAGVDHRLYATVSDPVGYAGLFVALLGATRPLGMLVAAVLLGGLLQGGQSLQIGVGLAPEIVQVFVGLVLLGYAVASRKIGRSHE
jgi:simple sugar transport system permease protein